MNQESSVLRTAIKLNRGRVWFKMNTVKSNKFLLVCSFGWETDVYWRESLRIVHGENKFIGTETRIVHVLLESFHIWIMSNPIEAQKLRINRNYKSIKIIDSDWEKKTIIGSMHSVPYTDPLVQEGQKRGSFHEDRGPCKTHAHCIHPPKPGSPAALQIHSPPMSGKPS